jgi:hypothetical protein
MTQKSQLRWIYTLAFPVEREAGSCMMMDDTEKPIKVDLHPGFSGREGGWKLCMMDDTEKPIKVDLHPGFAVAMRRREERADATGAHGKGQGGFSR